MDNVKFEIVKGELVIRVKVDGIDGKPSSSGKTKLLGTTSGTIKIPGGPDGLAMGLNVWVPNK